VTVGFAGWNTEHECSRCGFMLRMVWPSNMLVCDNSECEAEPMFLIRDE